MAKLKLLSKIRRVLWVQGDTQKQGVVPLSPAQLRSIAGGTSGATPEPLGRPPKGSVL